MAENIEARLERIAGLHDQIDTLFARLPDAVSKPIRSAVQKAILDNQEMTDLVAGIKHRRPPRFLLVGRTGVGKSSLINAMTGRYLSMVSDVKVGTKTADKICYKWLGKTLFEIIDSRGIAESTDDVSVKAEEALLQAIDDFDPDAILFLTRCKERAHVDKDVRFLNSISSGAAGEIPIIVLLAQADEMEPSREKSPDAYPPRKHNSIKEAVIQTEKILERNGISALEVLPVSSYIEWDADPKTVPDDEWHNLSIEYDGRYNIDKLLDLLEENIDIRAGIFLMLATRLDQAVRKISRKLTRIFSGIAATIALTPIPVSDIFVLVALQTVLIMLIAYLAGHDLSYDTATKYLISIAGVGAAGLGLRTLAQQGSKFLNLIFPGAGSAVSASIASTGTYAIGEGALRFYLDGASPEDVQDILMNARNEARQGEDEAATGVDDS